MADRGSNQGSSEGQGLGQQHESQNKRKDPAWKYNILNDPSDTNAVTCLYCNKVTKGGIHKAKLHQIGGNRNAAKCLKCPEHVRKELKDYMDGKHQQKITYDKPAASWDADADIILNEEDEVEKESRDASQKDKRVMMPPPKKLRHKGPMDSYMKKPEQVVKLRNDGRLQDGNITDKFDRERRAMTCQYIARFFYQAGIPFNVARMDSFKCMIEAIGQYGPNLKPPSYHELRVPMLKKEVGFTQDIMKNHKDMWKKYGCSIMLDGWTSRINRSLINFLVNSPAGTMFIKSVDASSYVKTADRLFELFDEFVDYVGEENIVQIVTDNGSNFKAAGQLLELKRKNLYWTPSAAHCLDLMLEDIGKLSKVSRTIARAINLTGYIYNHVGVLNMMREFTNQKELVRPGKTRFCTSYLTLKSIHEQKAPLRTMFTSKQLESSKWSKEAKAKRVVETVLMPSFWSSVVYILKVMGPLVRVLRLVDDEKHPAMGYIYEAMDRAKEAIQKAFKDNLDKCQDIFKIIDDRWNCQLHQPLHAAAYFLNPAYFYDNPNIEYDSEVTHGLISCIGRLEKNPNMQDRIMAELTLYKRADELFGVDLAVRARKTRAPAEWWSTYGSSAPSLQKLAIRILSLTCSASGCERNWSVFEQLHTKRRNRLHQKQLNDLVFVKYNQALKARYESKDLDPIFLNDIDESNEWLLGKMGAQQYIDEDIEDEPVFADDNGELTWGLVAEAAGVGEAIKNTRSQTKEKGPSSSKSKGKKIAKGSTPVARIEEVEEDDSDEIEKDIEGYKSNEGEQSDGIHAFESDSDSDN